MAQDDARSTDAVAQNSVKLSKMVAELAVGTPYMTLRTGLFCGDSLSNRTWTAGNVPQKISPFLPSFKTELESAGYRVITPNDSNLFDEDAGAADLEVAAVITGEHIEGCVWDDNPFKHTRKGDTQGKGSMSVTWQVYSPLKKQVVAHVNTTGTSRIDQPVAGGAQQLVIDAFAQNARQLAQSDDFRAAMSAPKALTAGFQMPGQQSKIELAGSLKAGKRKIADATGSVVTILTSSVSGSGFLVSSDGYILTDAHVVGDDKDVRVRWSDGLETLATVERSIKNRDVAILKTNPRDRVPLALRRGPVMPGQRVYAIGSPKGKKFEGTVSSGVISADRTMDGLRYVQSDVTVSHGSSGGPLLNENGEVIGLTDLGFENDGPAGLNWFTPIGDAMDFLALEQK
ncbi:MAG TPA: serine protease [Rhizomicrobium sp.]